MTARAAHRGGGRQDGSGPSPSGVGGGGTLGSEPTTVLIADDQADLRALLSRHLERAGFEVVGEADDGSGALRAVDELDPDVLLLDLTMPGMGGLEVLDRIGSRTRPRTVVLTGMEDPTLEEESRRRGATGFVVKGTSFAALVDEVRRVIGW